MPSSERTPNRPPRKSLDPDDDGSQKDINDVQLALVNMGSVARDHLALERTYLAYVRTSLGVSSAGVALMQFLRLRNDTRAFAVPIGAVALMTGLLILWFGTRQFFIVQKALVSGYFPPSVLEIAFTGIGLGSLVVVIFAVVISGRSR